MFFHTVFQSVVGHILLMRISCIPVLPLLMWYKVLYNLLYARLVSISPCSSTYAESIAKRRRYYIFSGRTFRNGALAPFTFRPHVRIHAEVIVACFITCCCRIRYKSNARLFAGKFVKSQPPSSLGRYRVDRGTRNMSPFHTNQEIVIFS